MLPVHAVVRRLRAPGPIEILFHTPSAIAGDLATGHQHESVPSHAFLFG